MVATAFDMFIDRLESMGVHDQFESIVRQHGVMLSEIFVDDRRNSVAVARKKCMRYLQQEMGKSTTEIADVFNRTHESVLRLLRTSDDMRYGRPVVTTTALRPMPTTAEANRNILIALARGFEQASVELKTSDPGQSEYMRGQAEGVRCSIRIMFPIQPKAAE